MKHKNIKIRRNGSLTIKQVLAKELKGTRFLFAKPRVLLLTNDVRHETSNQRTDHRLIMEKWVGFLNNTIASESLDTLENIIGRDVIGFKYLVEARN